MSGSIADYFLIFNDKLFYIAFNCTVLQTEGKVKFKLAQVSVEVVLTGAYFGTLHTQTQACTRVRLSCSSFKNGR
jgi:hypothetical protein